MFKLKMMIDNMTIETRSVLVADDAATIERRVKWYAARGWTLHSRTNHGVDRVRLLFKRRTSTNKE